MKYKISDILEDDTMGFKYCITDIIKKDYIGYYKVNYKEYSINLNIKETDANKKVRLSVHSKLKKL